MKYSSIYLFYPNIIYTDTDNSLSTKIEYENTGVSSLTIKIVSTVVETSVYVQKLL